MEYRNISEQMYDKCPESDHQWFAIIVKPYELNRLSDTLNMVISYGGGVDNRVQPIAERLEYAQQKIHPEQHDQRLILIADDIEFTILSNCVQRYKSKQLFLRKADAAPVPVAKVETYKNRSIPVVKPRPEYL